MGVKVPRRRWLVPLALFIAALALFIPTASGYSANWDAYSSSLAAWRIATTGEPWMEGVDFAELRGIKDGSVWTGELGGHLVTTRMFGPILAAVPFYWVGPYPDEASFSIFRGGITAAVFIAAAVVLIFLSARRWAGDLKALVGASVMGFTTPAWSVGANALWTHPMTMFGLAGAAWAASRDRWWLAGLFLGVGMWARPHIGVVAAVIGVGMAWSRREPRIAAAVGVPTTLSLAALGAWNKYVFNSWNPLGSYASHRLNSSVSDSSQQINQFENVAGFLISPDRGLLVWTPILVLLFPAVFRSWRTLPDWPRWLAMGGLAYTTLQLGQNYYGGADYFYGYRYALELLVCITPVYVLSVDAVGHLGRRIAPIVVALQFAMIVPGAVFETFYLDAEDVWRDNSYWYALRHVPQLFGPFTAVCLLAGAYVSVRLARPAGSAEHEDAELETVRD